MPIAFFSYSREDSEFALRLANDLRAAGSDVWIDQLDIGPGERWDRVVQSALENCPRVLVILSPASVNSNNVLDEVSFALDQQKTLIPVLYRDCDIPFRLRRFQHLDFRSDYERMLEELRKCLHVGQPAATTEPAPVPVTAETITSPAPVPRTPYTATPVERQPQHDARAAAPPPHQPAAQQAGSRFPMWAKIAIPAAVLLLLLIVLMNLGSNSDKRQKNTDQAVSDRDMNSDSTRPGDRKGAARVRCSASTGAEHADREQIAAAMPVSRGKWRNGIFSDKSGGVVHLRISWRKTG